MTGQGGESHGNSKVPAVQPHADFLSSRANKKMGVSENGVPPKQQFNEGIMVINQGSKMF